MALLLLGKGPARFLRAGDFKHLLVHFVSICLFVLIPASLHSPRVSPNDATAQGAVPGRVVAKN